MVPPVQFCGMYMLLFFQSADGSVLTSIASHAGFLLLTWIFWTAGAASITAALGGGHNCSYVLWPVLLCLASC